MTRGSWIYATVVLVWSALVLKFWRRCNAQWVLEWDFDSLRADRAVIRWEMRGQRKYVIFQELIHIVLLLLVVCVSI